jgi:hypothetical protein
VHLMPARAMLYRYVLRSSLTTFMPSIWSMPHSALKRSVIICIGSRSHSTSMTT